MKAGERGVVYAPHQLEVDLSVKEDDERDTGIDLRSHLAFLLILNRYANLESGEKSSLTARVHQKLF